LTAAVELAKDHYLGVPSAEVSPSYYFSWLCRIVDGKDHLTEREVRAALAQDAHGEEK
jgi:hypothetical protein